MHFHLKPEGIEKQAKRRGQGDPFLLTPTNSIHEISMSTSMSVEEITQPIMHVSHASAVVLHGDKLFFFGGYNQDGNAATTSIISFDGNNWKSEGNMNYARANASAVTLQEEIYVFCGESNGSYIRKTEIFSGGQCVEDQQIQSGYDRKCAATVAVGDNAFTIGGLYRYQTYTTYGNYTYIDKVQHNTTRIDIRNRQKFDGHNLNEGRHSFGTSMVGSKIFVCGGLNAKSQPVNSIEVLDTTNINNNTPWTILQQNPPCQLGQTSALLFGDDQMLVLGE
uniref:Kelch-like protein 12 n=1 Tax=Phallusia mammillata TaxID=59560 RepID=A0A6F9DF75_9ASCI|nr:kelch-like protein 12 [Phallusia mammillata]